MPASSGSSFPTQQIQVGDLFMYLGPNAENALHGGIYRYLGGDPRILLSSWLLIDGQVSANPNTANWGAAQAGAQWYNTIDSQRYGWNGSSIVILG